jgi:hypothetical protein
MFMYIHPYLHITYTPSILATEGERVCVCVRARDGDLQCLIRVQVGDRINGRKPRLEILDTKTLDHARVTCEGIDIVYR